MLLLGTENDLVLTVTFTDSTDGTKRSTKYWPEDGQIWMENDRGMQDYQTPESFMRRMKSVFDMFYGQKGVVHSINAQRMADKVLLIVRKAREQQGQLDKGPTKTVYNMGS